MESSVKVCLIEKLPEGGLRNLDERTWSKGMIDALNHVNYLTIGNEEYETIEGRLNIDSGMMELLVTKVTNK